MIDPDDLDDSDRPDDADEPDDPDDPDDPVDQDDPGDPLMALLSHSSFFFFFSFCRSVPLEFLWSFLHWCRNVLGIFDSHLMCLHRTNWVSIN